MNTWKLHTYSIGEKRLIFRLFYKNAYGMTCTKFYYVPLHEITLGTQAIITDTLIALNKES